ncbi:hypothetical protein [Microvirga terrestris]|uniref:Uncharacterized protein n=1 Tax=Microvirga terrestris TaxID=2791024 RepID=A0ABS0HVQ3_9HYPH|nr:hypothetical protein [Microvirga terrestris]MBF9197371.1 hypothetical protein [Microvirga terrestris]
MQFITVCGYVNLAPNLCRLHRFLSFSVNVTDTIASWMRIIELLAAWKNIEAGDTSKRLPLLENTVSVGATVFADTAAMTGLNASISRLADAISDASEA